METNDFIRRYTGVFTPEECRELISQIEYFNENHLMWDGSERTHRMDHRATNINVDLEVDLNAVTRINKMIFPKWKTCVDHYLNEFTVLGKKSFIVYDCKLKKIRQGGGFHNWHYENGNYMSCGRTFVIQVYLNDDFDGGETEFLYQNRREKAVAGDVIIFPSQYTHVHRGNPPIGGPKYIASSWGWIQSDKSDTSRYER